MKVICVDEDAPDNCESEDGGLIRVGEVYEVIGVFFLDGYIWYEVSIDIGYGYWENCFARCSEIDEMELVNKKEIVNS